MKILRIVYDWPPPWDGLGPHPYEVTVSQSLLGHDITVFCARWPNAGKIEEPKGTSVVGFIREPIEGTWFFTTSLLMFGYYLSWRSHNTPDIIHIHGHFGAWIYLYRRFLSIFNKNHAELTIPIVSHFHNTVAGRRAKFLSMNKPIKAISKYLSWPIAEWSDRQAIKQSMAHLFVSQDTRDEAIKFYSASPEKCTLVETGVNTHLFRPIGTEEFEKTRKDLGLDSRDIVILNYGKMVERKNIHLLVEALPSLPITYKLMLVGSGDGSYIGRMKERIAELGLTDRVIFVGYTPYPELPIAIQASNLFVLPSSWEGLPKVVMESLACKVKVLASGFRVSEDIRGLFYLESLDPKDIAAKIQEVVQTEVDVDRDRIIDKFSWDKRVQIIEKVYEKITLADN